MEAWTKLKKLVLFKERGLQRAQAQTKADARVIESLQDKETLAAKAAEDLKAALEAKTAEVEKTKFENACLSDSLASATDAHQEIVANLTDRLEETADYIASLKSKLEGKTVLEEDRKVALLKACKAFLEENAVEQQLLALKSLTSGLYEATEELTAQKEQLLQQGEKNQRKIALLGAEFDSLVSEVTLLRKENCELKARSSTVARELCFSKLTVSTEVGGAIGTDETASQVDTDNPQFLESQSLPNSEEDPVSIRRRRFYFRMKKLLQEKSKHIQQLERENRALATLAENGTQTLQQWVETHDNFYSDSTTSAAKKLSAFATQSERISALTRQIEDLKTELEDAHSDASTLQEALREARRANTQLVEERDSTYEKHVTEVKSRLGQIGDLEDELNRRTLEMKVAQETAQQRAGEQKAIIDNISTALKDKHTRVRELERKLHESGSALEEQQARVQSLQTALESHERQSQEQCNEIAKLKSKNVKLMEKVERMQEKQMEAESLWKAKLDKAMSLQRAKSVSKPRMVSSSRPQQGAALPLFPRRSNTERRISEVAGFGKGRKDTGGPCSVPKKRNSLAGKQPEQQPQLADGSSSVYTDASTPEPAVQRRKRKVVPTKGRRKMAQIQHQQHGIQMNKYRARPEGGRIPESLQGVAREGSYPRQGKDCTVRNNALCAFSKTAPEVSPQRLHSGTSPSVLENPAEHGRTNSEEACAVDITPSERNKQEKSAENIVGGPLVHTKPNPKEETVNRQNMSPPAKPLLQTAIPFPEKAISSAGNTAGDSNAVHSAAHFAQQSRDKRGYPASESSTVELASTPKAATTLSSVSPPRKREKRMVSLINLPPVSPIIEHLSPTSPHRDSSPFDAAVNGSFDSHPSKDPDAASPSDEPAPIRVLDPRERESRELLRKHLSPVPKEGQAEFSFEEYCAKVDRAEQRALADSE